MSIRTDDTKWRKFLETSFSGVIRGVLGFPLEHPFDCVKTRWQAKPELSSSLKVVQHIYQEKGILGFYTGGIPNGTRMVLKQAYRFPMMAIFPAFYNKQLPDDIKKKIPYIEKIMTGVTIASLESFIISPLERLKVWMMTSGKGKGINKFIVENRSRLISELYRGLRASYARQLATWTSFEAADGFFKAKAREYTQKDKLDFIPLFIASLFVAGVNTAVTLPFDFVKTHLQKADPLQSKKVFSNMRQLAQQHGFSVLYTGWRVKMVHYMLHSVYTVALVEKQEQSWKKLLK